MSAGEGKVDISGVSPLPYLSAIWWMHVWVFVHAFSSIYIFLDYPWTRVQFIHEFSPLLSPTHPLRLLTLTLSPSHPLTLISNPINLFSSTNHPFSNATLLTYHLHTFNLKHVYKHSYMHFKFDIYNSLSLLKVIYMKEDADDDDLHLYLTPPHDDSRYRTHLIIPLVSALTSHHINYSNTTKLYWESSIFSECCGIPNFFVNSICTGQV